MGCNVGCMKKVKRVFVLRERDMLAQRIATNARLMYIMMDYLDLKSLTRCSSVNMTFYCIAGKEQLLMKFSRDNRLGMDQMKGRIHDQYFMVPKPLTTDIYTDEFQRNNYSYILVSETQNNHQDQTILNSSRTHLSQKNSFSKLSRNNFLAIEDATKDNNDLQYRKNQSLKKDNMIDCVTGQQAIYMLRSNPFYLSTQEKPQTQRLPQSKSVQRVTTYSYDVKQIQISGNSLDDEESNDSKAQELRNDHQNILPPLNTSSRNKLNRVQTSKFKNSYDQQQLRKFQSIGSNSHASVRTPQFIMKAQEIEQQLKALDMEISSMGDQLDEENRDVKLMKSLKFRKRRKKLQNILSGISSQKCLDSSRDAIGILSPQSLMHKVQNENLISKIMQNQNYDEVL